MLCTSPSQEDLRALGDTEPAAPLLPREGDFSLGRRQVPVQRLSAHSQEPALRRPTPHRLWKGSLTPHRPSECSLASCVLPPRCCLTSSQLPISLPLLHPHPVYRSPPHPSRWAKSPPPRSLPSFPSPLGRRTAILA